MYITCNRTRHSVLNEEKKLTKLFYSEKETKIKFSYLRIQERTWNLHNGVKMLEISRGECPVIFDIFFNPIAQYLPFLVLGIDILFHSKKVGTHFFFFYFFLLTGISNNEKWPR